MSYCAGPVLILEAFIHWKLEQHHPEKATQIRTLMADFEKQLNAVAEGTVKSRERYEEPPDNDDMMEAWTDLDVLLVDIAEKRDTCKSAEDKLMWTDIYERLNHSTQTISCVRIAA